MPRSEIEFANGNFVSTSINLKNKSAGDGCRDKTIEKAMAVPETLLHPFATTKIVVLPATGSVIAGPIIVARSRDACSNATLCACRRRGERTSDRCDRDEGSKCLLHSRALLQDDAFGQ
jgi:hypothetical protein